MVNNNYKNLKKKTYSYQIVNYTIWNSTELIIIVHTYLEVNGKRFVWIQNNQQNRIKV